MSKSKYFYINKILKHMVSCILYQIAQLEILLSFRSK